ncbi:hypothetical protein HY992_02375 [Candidatus Micrarchaeota archaeon]|nr:hypothetical protein [Candidatus Micrarchaeota archaeon]
MAAPAQMKRRNEEQAKQASEQQAKKVNEEAQAKTSEQQAKQIIFAANNSLAELLCREAKANCGLAKALEGYEKGKMNSKPVRNDTSYG